MQARHASVLTSALIVLLTLACSGLSVYSDFDREVDFSSFETFDWSADGVSSLAQSDPLLHGRIADAVQSGLEATRLTKDTDDPDLYVTYHTNAQNQLRVDSTQMVFGNSWRWNSHWTWSTAPTTTRVHTYERGTLVMDVWDARTEQLVFRSSAEGVVPSNPGPAEARIMSAVERLIGQLKRQLG